MKTFAWPVVGIVVASFVIGCSEEAENPVGPSPVGELASGGSTAGAMTAAGGVAMPASTAAVGDSPWNDPLTGIALDPTGLGQVRGARGPAESVPTNLRVTDQIEGQLTFRWDPPDYQHSSFAITGYRVRRDYESWIDRSGNTRDERFRTLFPGRRYRFQVRAVYGDADGGFNGRVATLHATAEVGSSNPTLPWAPAPSWSRRKETITLTWSMDAGRYAGSSEVIRHEIGIGAPSNWFHTRNSRPRWSYAGQEAGETITYYVRAVNHEGAGPHGSVTVALPALSSTPPGGVRNFTATHITGNEYRLNWTRPSNFNSNDPVKTYHYYYVAGCPSASSRPYQVSNENTTSFEAVVYSASSDFGMKAENSAGLGPCVDAS